MADSKRQNIIDAIDTAFTAITINGGYETNLGLQIHWWRSGKLDQDELPAVIIKDLSCDIDFEDVPIGMQNNTLHIEAEVMTASGKTTPEQLRKLQADIYDAIRVDETWGALAQRTILEGDEVVTAEDEKTIGGSLIRFAVAFRTNRLNPYS